MTTLAASLPADRAAFAPAPRFYARMAATCFAVAVVGFAPTYWVPMARGTLDVAPIAHLHALFFYGWTLLFWWQASLAASGRIARHREVGVAGVALATGMCFVGLGMALHSLQLAVAAGAGARGRPFSILPITGIVLCVGRWFALFLAPGGARRRRMLRYTDSGVISTTSEISTNGIWARSFRSRMLSRSGPRK